MTDNNNRLTATSTKLRWEKLLHQWRRWRERRLRRRCLEISLHDISPQGAEIAAEKPDVVLIPRNKTRSYLMGFLPDGNPFVRTLQEFEQGSEHYAGSTMEEYYEGFRPKSIAEVFGLRDSELANVYPHAATLPWRPVMNWQASHGINVEQRQLVYKRPSRYGLDGKIDYGSQFYGPVSQGVGELEYSRHIKTHRLIKKNGYLPYLHGHLNGQFLVRGSEWVWVCHKGNHRYVALLATEADLIPVAFNSKKGTLVVRREEVETWPNVRNRLFSAEDALQVFDAIFAGRDWKRLSRTT